MGIKRGVWKPATYNKANMVKTGRYGARPAPIQMPGQSNSEHYINTRNNNNISGHALSVVSEERQSDLIRATNQNFNNEENNPSPLLVYSNSYKKSQELQNKFTKNAATTTLGASGGNSFGVPGGANVIRQAPEVYSPLFQIANLQLPRDRITMNAWNRNFYDTHPLVHNGVNLHATYPINKINIKCKDKKHEDFFNNMIDQDASLEFWKIGECFLYAELDEDKGVWKNINVLNPDYVHVKKAVVGEGSIISLRPDAALQALITSNNPADVKLREQMSPEIIHHVRKGENIPLDNFHISHLKMLSSPYDIHGTSPIVSVYKDLMLYDKLRECYSADTEILTDQGIMKGLDLAHQYKKPLPKVAYLNTKTEHIYYDTPTNLSSKKYEGDFYHFKGKKIDALFGPESKVWLKKCAKKGWTDWYFDRPEDIKLYFYKFKSLAYFNERTEKPDFIDVIGNPIPASLYMKVLGYIISEGCVYQNYKYGRYDNSVSMCQNTDQPHYEDMRKTFTEFAKLLGKNCRETIALKGSGFSQHKAKEKWEAKISNKELTNYFIDLIGIDNKCRSEHKRLPRWIFRLHSDLQRILLSALMAGDGHTGISKYGTNSQYFRYDTGSKQLADDVYELVYILGHTPVLRVVNRDGHTLTEYSIAWSTTNYGNEPRVYNKTESYGANMNKTHYSGAICNFGGLMVSRRNGKITIQNECPDDAEVLTDQGFINSAELIKQYNRPKIACFNADTNQIEYHEPINTHISKYTGPMYHFNGQNVDIMVTPEHRMWVSSKLSNDWSNWGFKQAKNISKGTMYRFTNIGIFDKRGMRSGKKIY